MLLFSPEVLCFSKLGFYFSKKYAQRKNLLVIVSTVIFSFGAIDNTP